MQQQMLLEEINPFVRAVITRTMQGGIPSQTAIAYDHRVFYVLSGSGCVEVAKQRIQIGPGSAMLWMSGTPYNFYPEEDLNLIVINFDFTQANNLDSAAHPMVAPENFDPQMLLEQVEFTNAAVLNKPLVLHDFSAILPYLQSMLQESSVPTIWSPLQLGSFMRLILVYMCQASTHLSGKRATASFEQLLRYINEHYTEPLSNSSLAKQFNYHPNYISQLFAQNTGVTLHQYLLRIRVRQALYLLQTTNLSVSEIAAKSGFGNVSYFCQYFKKCTGYPPSSFRL